MRDDLNISFSCISPLTNNPGNISSSPEFLDSLSGNYYLSTNSPCIDSGTSTGSPNIDILGALRPLDGNDDGYAVTDIGTYELIPNGMSLISRVNIPSEDTGAAISWMGYTNHFYSLRTTTNLLESMNYISEISNKPGCNAIMVYTGSANAAFYCIEASKMSHKKRRP